MKAKKITQKEIEESGQLRQPVGNPEHLPKEDPFLEWLTHKIASLEEADVE